MKLKKENGLILRVLTLVCGVQLIQLRSVRPVLQQFKKTLIADLDFLYARASSKHVPQY